MIVSSFNDLYDMNNIELILKDDHYNVEMYVDKKKLCTIPYFNSMLTKFKKADHSNIEIIVRNAFVSHDTIMYQFNKETNIGNLPQWKHILESIECYEYFGLEFNYSLLYDLQIPEKEFASLIRTYEISSNRFVITKLISRLLPKNYDFSNVSKSTLEDILSTAREYHIVSRCGLTDILIWNNRDRSIIKFKDIYFCNYFIQNNISYRQYEYQQCEYQQYDKPINTLISNCYPVAELIEQSNAYNDIIRANNNIIFSDLQSGPQIINIIAKSRIELETNIDLSVAISSDSKLYAYTYGIDISVYNIETNKIINKINKPKKYKNAISKIYFCAQDTQILATINGDHGDCDDCNDCDCYDHICNAINDQHINVYLIDLKTKSFTKTRYTKLQIYNLCTSPTVSELLNRWVAYSYDKKKVAIVSKKNEVIDIYDLSTGLLLNRLISNSQVTFLQYSPDDSELISINRDRTIELWDSITGNKLTQLDNFFSFPDAKNYGTKRINKLCLLIPNNYDLIESINRCL